MNNKQRSENKYYDEIKADAKYIKNIKREFYYNFPKVFRFDYLLIRLNIYQLMSDRKCVR